MAKFVELILAALQFQAEGLLEMTNLLVSSAVDPEKMRREFYRIPTYERHWFATNWAEAYRHRQQFHVTLQYLKRQGLAVKRDKGRSIDWLLTKRGAKRLQAYQQARADYFSAAYIFFKKPKGDGVTIVAFDIPEKERRKREWLRACLVEMDFKPLQKSVWAARGAVEEEFLHALRERNLLGAVQIFSVNRSGTIEGAG